MTHSNNNNKKENFKQFSFFNTCLPNRFNARFQIESKKHCCIFWSIYTVLNAKFIIINIFQTVLFIYISLRYHVAGIPGKKKVDDKP